MEEVKNQVVELNRQQTLKRRETQVSKISAKIHTHTHEIDQKAQIQLPTEATHKQQQSIYTVHGPYVFCCEETSFRLLVLVFNIVQRFFGISWPKSRFNLATLLKTLSDRLFSNTKELIVSKCLHG